LHLSHLRNRAQQGVDWKEKNMTKNQCMSLLQNTIRAVFLKKVREDVGRFIPDDQGIEIWPPQHFNDLVQKIKYK